MLAGNVDSANDIVPGSDDDDPGWLDLVDASICGVEHSGDRVEAYLPVDGALQVTLQLVSHGGSISDRVRAGEGTTEAESSGLIRRSLLAVVRAAEARE